MPFFRADVKVVARLLGQGSFRSLYEGRERGERTLSSDSGGAWPFRLDQTNEAVNSTLLELKDEQQRQRKRKIMEGSAVAAGRWKARRGVTEYSYVVEMLPVPLVAVWMVN